MIKTDVFSILLILRFMTSKMGGKAAQHLLERAALGVREVLYMLVVLVV
jgi:hypothetical protein